MMRAAGFRVFPRDGGGVGGASGAGWAWWDRLRQRRRAVGHPGGARTTVCVTARRWRRCASHPASAGWVRVGARVSTASEIRVHLREERGVRTPGGERNPDFPHGDADARTDFEQREPNRLTLRRCEPRPGQAETAERREHDIGDRRKGEPQLIRAHRGGTGAIGKEHQLLLLDPIFHVAARAIEHFVERLRIEHIGRE